MKIEKVSENQICCTLTREDLANRQMCLSELAYGTEKAKRLFNDVIRQASYEYGFEPDDFPIMVEAIPMPEESIIVLITKVEYPEELDARFSDFSAFEDEDASFDDVIEDAEAQMPGADDVIDYFKRLRKKSSDAQADNSKQMTAREPEGDLPDLVQIFEFQDMGQLEKFAVLVGDFYTGKNVLYRVEPESVYALILHKDSHTPEEFNRISNLASEYGRIKPYSPAINAYYKEHGKLLLEGMALQTIKNQLF